MRRGKKNIVYTILYVLLPLLACIAAGVASFLWREAHPPAVPEVREESAEMSMVPRRPASPEEFSKEFEKTLALFLADYGIGEKGIRRARPDSSAVGVRNVYRVNIPLSFSLTLMHLKLREKAGEIGGESLGGVESADGRTLRLTFGVNARPVEIVIFQKTPGMSIRRAVVAVIIDDLGVRDIENARILCSLGQTVTLAVLPFQGHTADVVQLANETGTPYILHMPMEPHSSSENPGRGAIRVSDSDEVVRRKLDSAFESVGGAPGMNNHMGSRVTEDPRVMDAIMESLRENGRFFVDSRTSNRSVAYALSQRSGVKGAAISGYIDTVEERNAIRDRLYALVESAYEKGPALIIGHDRPLTIQTLEQEIPRLAERGVRFVGAGELVK